MPVTRLDPEALRTSCDPERLSFETTAQLEDLATLPSQDRAREASWFGVSVRRHGYNLFAMGSKGLGKDLLIEKAIEGRATLDPVPGDWCYLHNFDDPDRPRALSLPQGMGRQLREDMTQLVMELGAAIPGAFEGDEYQTRRKSIEDELSRRQEKTLSEINDEANEKGVFLMRTPVGFVFAPLKDGRPLPPAEFAALPEEEKDKTQEAIQDLERKLQEKLREFPRWEKEARSRIRELNREVTEFAVGQALQVLIDKYTEAGIEGVVAHLKTVREDIVRTMDEAQGKDGSPGALKRGALRMAEVLERYSVNLLVSNEGVERAPVVHEDQPTFQNLLGRVEHLQQMGTLVTDFSLIKAGALHRANGGYLVVDALKLLTSPLAWEGLKRALRQSEIRIDSVTQFLSIAATVSLEPEPIPLDVKVILLGDRILYHLLATHDPDFPELFKVAVDFDEELERTAENEGMLARFIAGLCRRESLRPLDRCAVARIIDEGARLVGDQKKVTAQLDRLSDLVREVDFWAGESGREVGTAIDVEKAIRTRNHRMDRVRRLVQEQIERGTLLIDTRGQAIGQVNGLSVLQLGDATFGRPSRITARVSMGTGKVVDIEREVELGGPIHSKGVLILSAFLASRYATGMPLSLAASLVFEQSYSGVDGDSASSAELYALLSALAEVPIDQSFAVTGSVNQNGEVQAIGGANEKIEGFFEVCAARGLTGQQGVLIPASNVQHLMLREDVVVAVREGKFHVYPIETIDQGIELLTGVVAGERDGAKVYPAESINGKVEARLRALARARRDFLGPGGGKDS
jgi:lon-related putative ATP-dependent protease